MWRWAVFHLVRTVYLQFWEELLPPIVEFILKPLEFFKRIRRLSTIVNRRQDLSNYLDNL